MPCQVLSLGLVIFAEVVWLVGQGFEKVGARHLDVNDGQLLRHYQSLKRLFLTRHSQKHTARRHLFVADKRLVLAVDGQLGLVIALCRTLVLAISGEDFIVLVLRGLLLATAFVLRGTIFDHIVDRNRIVRKLRAQKYVAVPSRVL